MERIEEWKLKEGVLDQPLPQYYCSSVFEYRYQQANDRSLSVAISRLWCLKWAIGTSEQVEELEFA
jgi:hypothetical protein